MKPRSLSPFDAPIARAETEVDRAAAAERDARQVVTQVKMEILLRAAPMARAAARDAALEEAEEAAWTATKRWLRACVQLTALRAQRARWHHGS